MKIGAMILSSTLLLSAPLLAGEKTDLIYMKNGDRLTCEIQSLDAGALYISLDYVNGNIAVEWSKVVRLDSPRLFIVQLEDGSAYVGTLSLAEAAPGQPRRFQLLQPTGQTVLIDPSQIVVMGETSDKFWQRFNGSVSSGIIYSKGNQTAQYSVSATLAYPRPRWGVQTTLNSSLSANTDSKASTRNQLSLFALHDLPWKEFFYAGLGSLLQSSEQGIQLQTNLGGGLGRYLKHTNRVSLWVLAGLGWQGTSYQQFTVPQPSQDILAAMIATELRVSIFKKTNLSISGSAYPALTQSGEAFFTANATYYLKLFGNLSWNFSFYGNWATQPPPNYSGSNYGLGSGLGLTFGNW